MPAADSMHAADAVIRRLTPADVVEADQLRADAGWNQTHLDWHRLIEFQPDGCFAAVLADRIVGTVTTTCYSSKLAWIGMMLVHQDWRRQGIGRRLLQRALQYLNSRNVACIKLDATPAGRPLYSSLGFQIDAEFCRWSTNVSPRQFRSMEQLQGSFCPFRHDEDAFGAERTQWLERLADDSTTVCSDEGMGMIRPGATAAYLGPVSAVSPDSALRMICSLLSTVSGPVYWDIPPANDEALVLATALGFRPVRRLTRMWTGRSSVNPAMNMQFALADPATG